MKNSTVVQVMDSLGLNRGGLTRAVFDRFRLLAEGRRAVLVTVAHQPDVNTIFRQLVECGDLPTHTELLSYHRDMAHRPVRGEAVVSPALSWSSDPNVVGVPDVGNIVRYFSGGRFVGLVSCGEDGSLRFADIHDVERPWVRLYRDTFGASNHLQDRSFYDENGKLRFRSFHTREGKAYLSSWVNTNGYYYRAVDFGHESPDTIGDLRAVNAIWLRAHLSQLGPCVVYCDEPRTTFALDIKSEWVAHIASIHTTHFRDNASRSSGLKHWLEHYKHNLDHISAVVAFTDGQCEDLQKDLPSGGSQVVRMIHPSPSVKDPSVETPPRRLVIVSRLDPDKRIDDAIRAFAAISSSLPDAELLIYGSGPDRSRLARVIAELNVSHSVKLMGYTSNSLDVFRGARASIATSRFEGFGLTLLESMSVGTPVIGYNVIYGPRDVIVDGVNGWSVSDGDIDALGQSMCAVLEASDLGDFRKAAISTAESYTREKWSQQWRELHDRASTSVVKA